MKLNCIIIDDEPIARKGLKEYISDVDFLNLVGEFDSAMAATTAMEDGKVQLVFLDVHMPKITGVEFLRSLSSPPLVIFTTAYPQYALEGFDLNVLDYLLKPISFDRFLKACMKAKDAITHKSAPSGIKDEDFIFIKADNKLVKINYADILFVEALQNYVTVHTASKKFVTYLTMKGVEESLPPSMFLKIHKSYLINLQRIESIEGNQVRIGTHYLPISRTIKEEVMEKLLKGKYLKR